MSVTADRTNMDAAVRRITASASTDDGYRAQLVNLADSHQGIYRRALDVLYATEKETFGDEEATLRRGRDDQLLADTRDRERRQKLVAEFEHAVSMAEAGEQAAISSTCRPAPERRPDGQHPYLQARHGGRRTR
jgi:hypothetical protein